MKVSSPFIQSVYSRMVRASASGSALWSDMRGDDRSHLTSPEGAPAPRWLSPGHVEPGPIQLRLTRQPPLLSDSESKSAAGTGPAAGSLGCAGVKNEVLAFRQ